jgi:hypothetical protein
MYVFESIVQTLRLPYLIKCWPSPPLKLVLELRVRADPDAIFDRVH